MRELCVLVAMVAVASNVTADDMERVETELVAQVLIETRGPANEVRRKFAPATLLAQGQVVYYTLRIRNPTSDYLRNLTVSQRIPENTEYVPDSAAGPGAEITFSVDGGLSFARPEELRIADATGAERPAPAAAYTHIRWRLRNPLAPGAVALARFRAVFQ